MKNFRLSPKLFFVATLLVGIFTVSVFSCKENVEVVKTTSQPTASTSFLRFEEQNLDYLNATFVDIKEEVPKPIYTLTTEISRQNINDIVLTTLGTIVELSKITKIIIFTHDQDLSNLQKENIEAISIFSNLDENGYVDHSLYKKQGNGWVKEVQYDCKSNFSVKKGIINIFASSLLAKNESVKWVIFNVKDEFKNYEPSKYMVIPDFDHNIVNNGSVILTGRVAAGECAGASICVYDPGAYCDDNGHCQSSGGFTVSSWAEFKAKLGLPCMVEQISEQGSKNGRLGKKIDVEELRNFRDNYMSKTKIGRDYVLKYYKISEIITKFDAIQKVGLSESFDFVVKMQEIAETLNNGKPDEIVISPELQKELAPIIYKFKNISTNKEFQQILNQAEIDLNKYTGKTNTELAKMLN